MSSVAVAAVDSQVAARSAARSTLGRALVVALAITLVHLMLACALSPASSMERRYRSLLNWDSGWYVEIARDGYHHLRPVPGKIVQAYNNVAFFPAYPLLARSLHCAFGIDAGIAVLLVAESACVAFWAYLVLLLEGWRVRRPVQWLVIAAMLAYPTTFYLVTGYSESLFLAATLGFFYWSERPGKGAWLLAAGHGAVMTATRLLGIAFIAYPVVALAASLVASHQDWRPACRRLAGRLALGLAAAGGALAFFAYCQLRFHHWDLYFTTQDLGWDHHPVLLAPIHYLSYRSGLWLRTYRALFDVWGGYSYNALNHLSVPWIALLFGGVAALELTRGRHHRWQERLPLYVSAFCLYWLAVAAMAYKFAGLARYLMCVWLLVALALARFSVAAPARWRRSTVMVLGGVALAVALIGVALQVILLLRFTRGYWIV